MPTLLIVLALAFALGFAAHRASVCTVRAVAEAVHSRTFYMFGSIAKTVLWVVAITLPFYWLTQPNGPYLGGWQLTLTAVLGGFSFGVGAGINGACAYSTMARLMDGEGRMAAAVGGFAIGVFLFVLLVDGGVIARPMAASTQIGLLADWTIAVTAVLAVLAIIEVVRLWRTRPEGTTLKDLVLARQYRLSTAALVIGLAGAAIYLLFGAAGYTSTFEVVVEGALGTKAWPATERWLILVAVLAGMLASTIERGSFRLNIRPRADWLRNIAGGVLMGLGVAMTPGGNDVIVLYSLPLLSPHAIPSFAAMAVGILGGLAFMRFLFGVELRVSCRNDLYVSG